MVNKIVVVTAHPGDFIWSSGGTLYKYSQSGCEIHVIALTDGLRCESPIMITDDCSLEGKRRQIESASSLLNITSVTFLGYDDMPLEIDNSGIIKIASIMNEMNPDIILTHAYCRDNTNPDHEAAAEIVNKAAEIASSNHKIFKNTMRSRPIPIFGFEPDNPENSRWIPGTFIDITPCMDMKMEAITRLPGFADRSARIYEQAVNRAIYCSGRGGVNGCKYAEAFSGSTPICDHGYFVW